MIDRYVNVPWIAAMALVVVVTSAVGCGGGNGSDGAGPAPTATVGAGAPAATAPAGASTGSRPAGGAPSPATSPRSAPSSSPEDTGTVLRMSEWTSQPLRVVNSPATTPTLVAVRGAHHEDGGTAFDRLVFQFDGQLPGYDVRYVPEVRSPGEGAPVPLRGQAFMELVFSPAASHDDTGSSTLRTSSSGGGLPGLHEYRMAGDFEGYVHYGLGVDDVVGFRVTEFAQPSRIAVDIFA